MTQSYPSTTQQPPRSDMDTLENQVEVEARTVAELEPQRLAEILSSTVSKPTTRFDVPPVSPMCNAHMSEYDTTVCVPRHHSYFDYSPYSSSPSTAVNSRAPSPTKHLEDDNDEEEDLIPEQHRLKWRLASGFFALFLGGWADGGDHSHHSFS